MGLFSGRGGGVGLASRASNWIETLEAANQARRTSRGSPVPVTWTTAQGIPAALDAIRLRHDLISTLPVQVFRRMPDGTSKQVDTPLVLQEPQAGESGDIINWLAASQKSLDMRGNAYGVIVDRDSSGIPTQIELQHPDWVLPWWDPNGLLYYTIWGKRYETRDVWHEKSNDEPGLPFGLSPITACARALGIDIASEQFGADYFRDGTFPSGLLASEDDLEPDEAKLAKRQFIDSLDGRREPVVLGGNWSWQALSITPNESQFLDTMKFGVNQVARIFNVDPELIGGGHEGSSITYANREQRAIDFLTYRLNPSIRRREAALTKLTVRGQFVKLNRSALLATDLLTRLKAYDLGLKNAVYALEEPRQLEDRQPLTPDQLEALKEAGLLGKPTAASTADATINATGA